MSGPLEFRSGPFGLGGPSRSGQAAPVDSESWTCQGCRGQMIGKRTPDDLCRQCLADRLSRLAELIAEDGKQAPQPAASHYGWCGANADYPNIVPTAADPVCPCGKDVRSASNRPADDSDAGRLAAIRANLGEPEPLPDVGPFETEPFRSPAVVAVHEAFRADPGAGKMHPRVLKILTAAISAAGVELGEYDRRIVSWLAGWEPTTVVVVAGIIRRAAAGKAAPADPGHLTAGDLGMVLASLDVAAEELRERAASCPECYRDFATDPCGTCESRLARAAEFDDLAAKLGGAR